MVSDILLNIIGGVCFIAGIIMIRAGAIGYPTMPESMGYMYKGKRTKMLHDKGDCVYMVVYGTEFLIMAFVSFVGLFIGGVAMIIGGVVIVCFNHKYKGYPAVSDDKCLLICGIIMMLRA